LVVVLPEGRGQVRRREEREEPLRDWADPVGRDDVAREGLAPRAVGVAGGRIVDLGGRLAEVAAAVVRRRDVVEVDLAEVVARALVVGEEEELVVDDRTAERGAELLVA